MPFYPNEVIQQLKAQADISLVIQQFIPLKKSGNGRFVGMCPFHDDRFILERREQCIRTLEQLVIGFTRIQCRIGIDREHRGF